MKKPEPGKWLRTSPFAILFFVGRILRLVAKNAWQSLAPLFALLLAYEGDLVSKLAVGGIAFTVAVATASVLSYWFFRFQLRDDSILIRHGVIKKKQLDIKFERIQGVNTTQNPVYRALGLVSVSFDTAGSAGSEGILPAVTRAFADSLRARIGGRDGGGESAVENGRPSGNILIRNDWRDMIRIGLADRRALILLAFIGPMMENIGDRLDEWLERLSVAAAANGIQMDAATGLSIGAAIFVAALLVLVVGSIAAAFLRYHKFELCLVGRALRSSGGLLTRHEHSMDLGKIQTLRLEQGIVQRLQNRFRMTARQAVASGKHRSQKTFSIPLVSAAQADRLRCLFLEPEAGSLSQDPDSGAFQPVSAYFMRSRILFVGLLPSLIGAIALWPALGATSVLFLLWLPIVSAAAYRNWKRAGFVHDDEEIVRRSGLLGYRTVGLLFRKVQRVTVTQSRYQRRKGLASLRMYMASGSVRIPYVEHTTAKRLRDYILYKVESSPQAWH